MQVPPAEHPAWLDIITGRRRPSLSNFAARVFVGRWDIQLRREPRPELMRAAAFQLRELFVENAPCRTVQDDLKNIFG